ncbi:MAG: phage gp6-like head-tail connector protein [Bacilli bacterium]|nr:phage gp6-like head-tail connector protein [Methanobrevibacter sp.]MBR1748261.1 phage gp6-like head-tail connector protein [Bacilli bacterium]
MFCTVDEVKDFTGVKPKHLNFSKEDSNKLDEILEKWIKQSEGLIKSYCNNNFTEAQYPEGIPEAVQSVCLRLTSNMVALATARRDTPITTVNDWQISIVNMRIFTNDLKDDLEPYKIDKSRKSDKIDLFAITGEGIW